MPLPVSVVRALLPKSTNRLRAASVVVVAIANIANKALIELLGICFLGEVVESIMRGGDRGLRRMTG